MENTALTNLCFHGIGRLEREREPGESAYWTSRETYRRILDLVVDRDDVRISFDDGNASDVQIGLPELTNRGLLAIFFPIADRLGESGSLGRDDLQELRLRGMTIGSHGMRHRSWRHLTSDSREDEFDRARAQIAEAAGTEVTTAACPLGAYDRSVLVALWRRGYRSVHTSDRARARRDAWLQPRYSVRASDGVDDIRALVEHPPPMQHRLKAGARILAKSLR
ncbi:polysaccharide deacetylase family protein [Georgenia yuyongxinii]|uniref:Polysaccharide deacetylase family protein n=1 Tax=Georgenia yuyongxinii TaxID=2589797 RepID=A0A552WLC2_9MICO|nr:polysaccharide deacetylase family protein [Georgenia yuyongxinii]TRW43571.1 polysaccharide deacetylase family protein [Georgenia yuyongxinii]